MLAHLADGLTNQQIADRLVISPVTVRNHVSSILAKLQVTEPAGGDAPVPGRRRRVTRSGGEDLFALDHPEC